MSFLMVSHAVENQSPRRRGALLWVCAQALEHFKSRFSLCLVIRTEVNQGELELV
jgi:hypothetical protein